MWVLKSKLILEHDIYCSSWQFNDIERSHWQRQNKQGLLHRSPPIEGSGAARFVVVFDPIYENWCEF